MRSYVEQFTHLLANLHVVVVEELPLALEKRADVVGVVVEKRRLTVCTEQRMPMDMPPVTVVADAYVPDLLRPGGSFHRHSQRLRTVGSGNHTAVAVGLLAKSVASLDENTVVAVQFLIPLHRPEVGCTKKNLLFCHRNLVLRHAKVRRLTLKTAVITLRYRTASKSSLRQ